MWSDRLAYQAEGLYRAAEYLGFLAREIAGQSRRYAQCYYGKDLYARMQSVYGVRSRQCRIATLSGSTRRKYEAFGMLHPEPLKFRPFCASSVNHKIGCSNGGVYG